MRKIIFLLLCMLPVVSLGQQREAEGFVAAWSAGDVAKAGTYWTSTSLPAFDRHVRRPLTNGCVTVHEARVEGVRAAGDDRAEAAIAFRVTRQSAMPGAREQHATVRALLQLKRDRGAWRIESWRDAEEQLLDELLAQPDRAARAAWLDAHARDWSPAFVRALTMRIWLLMQTGRTALASELLGYCARVAGELGDDVSQSYAYSAEASTLDTRTSQEVQQGTAAGDLAVKHAEASGDPDALAMALLRRARAVKLWDSVASYTERAIALLDHVDDVGVVSLAASQLSAHHRSYGDSRLGLYYSAMAARLAEQAGDAIAEVTAGLSFVAIYANTGDYELAARYSDRVTLLARTHGFDAIRAAHAELLTRSKVATQSLLPELLENVNDAMKAAVVREKPHFQIALLVSRARIHLTMGDLESAEQDVVDALAIDDPDNRKAYFVLAEIRMRQGQHKQARISMDLAPRLWFPHEWVLYGEALHREGLYEEAEILARCGIDYTEYQYDRGSGGTRAREAFLSSRYALEQLLVELLVRNGKKEEALQVAEAAKARVLRDVARRSRRFGDPSSPNGAAEQRLMERVEALNRRVLTERDEAKAVLVREELAEARLQLDEFRTLTAVRDRGHELYEYSAGDVRWPFRDAAAVEYVIGDRNIIVFVIRAGGDGGMLVDVEVVPVPRGEIAQLVDELRDHIGRRDLRHARPARRLYDLLIAPVEKYLGDAATLCVIPDGVLWKVPFQALMTRASAPLIDRFALFYSPSMQMLHMVSGRRTRDAKPRLLALGNPRVENSTAARYRSNERATILGDLAEAETEVRRIARLYGKEHSKVYLRAEAREALFKQQAAQFDVLHVASHGIVDSVAPRFSALVLAAAPDDGEDGLLEAHEVADLNLDADLVVLSACDTASGKVGGGEGMLGLSWAFLAAGAESLVGSQWKAPSAATEVLMVAFHERLVAGDSPAEALRRAQRAVSRDSRFESPLDWAPFVVVGHGF